MSPKLEVLLGTDLTLEQRLLPHVTKRQEIHAEIERLEAEKSALSDDIANEILATGTDRAVVGEWNCRVSPGVGRKSIDRASLIMAGVAVEVVDGATKTGKATPFLDVRAAKGKP